MKQVEVKTPFKPDWDLIRAVLAAMRDRSTYEGLNEDHQDFLKKHGIIELQSAAKSARGKSVPFYKLTEKGQELADLMKDDVLWKKTKTALIDNQDLSVNPDELLTWLKDEKQAKAP